MPIFSKESLERLRERIDLPEVVSAHIDLKRSGASFKALCPFHDERTPSFVIQKGDSHYHCFGCGAHGDAIQFLIEYLKMNFMDAVQSLAERFNVVLETVESTPDQQGPSKTYMKEALEFTTQFYHFYLLHTEEGHKALNYLYSRGLDLEFIQRFRIGLAPKDPGLFIETMHAKRFSDDILIAAGLLSEKKREFFQDRITFPIQDPAGAVIGFSARKYKEETFGGKYVNTPETPLFKKSKVLFGLNFSRRRIAKERKAIIVEGQIDALRLIQSGFEITVAGQGTAFGEGHVRELLNLGVNEVWLAFDSDEAGQGAAVKVGDSFQKAGVEVRVIEMPPKADPDSFLTKYGPEAFATLIEQASDYLSFLVKYHAKRLDTSSPAQKNELVQTIATQIRNWDEPVMVHESLRKLAHLAQVSESLIGVDTTRSPNIYIKKRGNIGVEEVNPDLVLESDFLRWLFLMGEVNPHFIDAAKKNMLPEALKHEGCRQLYQEYLYGKSKDLLTLAITNEDGQKILDLISQKRINKDRSEAQFMETIQKILDRNWMQERETIRMKIQSGECGDDEVLELVKQFEKVRKNQPVVVK